MLASLNAATPGQVKPVNPQAFSQKVQALVSKAGYESPKVVSFSMGGMEDSLQSYALAGNG